MAKEETDSLFEESSQGAIGAVGGLIFILSLVLFFGGIWLMSFPFGVIEDGQPAFWTFWIGLLSSALGLGIPFTVLPAIGK